MTAKTNWIKGLILSSVVIFSLSLANNSLALTKIPTKHPAATRVDTSPLQVQSYKGKGLDIEFRYVRGKLKNMRIMNTTKSTVKIDLLDNRYILGAGDYVVIDPPSIDLIRVKLTRLYGDATLMDTLFPDRFTYYMTFRLPLQQDNKKISAGE